MHAQRRIKCLEIAGINWILSSNCVYVAFLDTSADCKLLIFSGCQCYSKRHTLCPNSVWAKWQSQHRCTQRAMTPFGGCPCQKSSAEFSCSQSVVSWETDWHALGLGIYHTLTAFSLSQSTVLYHYTACRSSIFLLSFLFKLGQVVSSARLIKLEFLIQFV